MIMYLLKMIACSAAFYAVYHFFFSKEKMLVFNRVYLLFSLVASFIIPLITFTVYIPASAVPAVEVYPMNDAVVNMVTESVAAKPDYLLWISVAIASFITLILFIRLVKNLLRLHSSIRQSEKIHFENVQLILIEKETVPFSFMQNIFINKNEYEQGRVADAVIAHEMAHIQQKHSWDILFVELLQVFTWFNPMLYLYKSAIKTNHEFLADEAVVQQTADRLHYQQLLLQSVYVNNNIPLASSFYFTTKKRLIMLQKTFKRKRAVWAGMAAVPLLALVIYFLSSKVYAQTENADLQSSGISNLNNTDTTKKPNSETVKKTEVTIMDESNNPSQRISYPENVEGVKLFKSNNKETVVTIEYRDGKIITEDISTPDKKNAVEKKYGIKLPIEPTEKFTPPIIVNNKTGEKSISNEEMKEYEGLMKEMAVKKNGRTEYKFIDGKTQKAAEIYKRMSVGQRRKVAQFPPPPPPASQVFDNNGEKKLQEVIVIPFAESMTEIDNKILPKNVKSINCIYKSEWGEYVALIVFKNKTYKRENISTPEEQSRFEKLYNVKVPKQKLRGTVTITDKEMKEFDKLLKESVVVIDGIKRFKKV